MVKGGKLSMRCNNISCEIAWIQGHNRFKVSGAHKLCASPKHYAHIKHNRYPSVIPLMLAIRVEGFITASAGSFLVALKCCIILDQLVFSP